MLTKANNTLGQKHALTEKDIESEGEDNTASAEERLRDSQAADEEDDENDSSEEDAESDKVAK